MTDSDFLFYFIFYLIPYNLLIKQKTCLLTLFLFVCLFVCCSVTFLICNIHAQNPLNFCCKLVGEKRKQISQASLLFGLTLMQQFFFPLAKQHQSFYVTWMIALFWLAQQGMLMVNFENHSTSHIYQNYCVRQACKIRPKLSSRKA